MSSYTYLNALIHICCLYLVTCPTSILPLTLYLVTSVLPLCTVLLHVLPLCTVLLHVLHLSYLIALCLVTCPMSVLPLGTGSFVMTGELVFFPEVAYRTEISNRRSDVLINMGVIRNVLSIYSPYLVKFVEMSAFSTKLL